MKQYFSIKERYADAIVLFRLGDFYEMFGEDAERASRILQITLTSRDKSGENPIPMCGVPYFAADSYISKLIKAGCKVAVCEQMEDPKDVKGIVARDVVKVITPGTHVPEHPKENVFIVAVYPSGSGHGVAAADVSTGEFMVFETKENIADEISRFEPREVVVPESMAGNIHYREALSGFYTTFLEDWYYDYSEAYRTLLKQFRVASLEGYGCDSQASVCAAGALLAYLENTQKERPAFDKITALNRSETLFMDASTQRNLELTHSTRDGSREGTLLWVLDETLTPMGGRFLRTALLRPLTDSEKISARHNAVECLIHDYEAMEELRSSLRRIQDLERLSLRVSSGSACARDLIAVKNSLAALPRIRKTLASCRDEGLRAQAERIAEFPSVLGIIEKGIADNPPHGIRDGGIIKDGYNRDIDELRGISSKGKDFLSEMEAREKKRTGISSLKIGFNRVFGYYIEITKANLHLAPDDYIRKQTLVGGERFITAELKDYENRVLGSEEKLKALEYEVFQEILSAVRLEAERLMSTSSALAETDFLVSLAVAAKRHNYVRPEITDDVIIDIVDGRHPVLERVFEGDRFIPNGAYLDDSDCRLIILTGPNMAGKSTYMRQVAIIALMAQVGSFVPAASARIGISDRIFTRIGASDFLAKGQSTFMVEMIEAANIVNNATERSLIILDEVGRGTSTFDGISIAWAIAEHIVNRIKARTLFATHYNELTELALTLDGVRNFNVSVREWGDEIIFLRKIEEGPADKSYGIQVARLAGIPEAVLARSKEILNHLEKEELNEAGKPKMAAGRSGKKREQLDLFSSSGDSVVADILNLDPDAMTPQQALEKLRDLRRKVSL